MSLLKEDVFAPVVSIVSVGSDDESLELASHCEFELGASIFSEDVAGALQMASRIRAGIVSVNDLIVPSADPRVPFGGRSKSGYGVTRGAEGLLELTRVKVVQVRHSNRVSHFGLHLPELELMSAFLRAVHGGSWRVRLEALVEVFRLGYRAWLGRRK
jgi:delta 1-pyrroline-5-carboxylate dehydrogenase